MYIFFIIILHVADEKRGKRDTHTLKKCGGGGGVEREPEGFLLKINKFQGNYTERGGGG